MIRDISAFGLASFLSSCCMALVEMSSSSWVEKVTLSINSVATVVAW